MAAGDAAAAAGLATFPATQDARQGYENDNVRGDELAAHLTSATAHPIGSITGSVPASRVSGVLPAEHGGTGQANSHGRLLTNVGATGSPTNNRLAAVDANGEFGAVSGTIGAAYLPDHQHEIAGTNGVNGLQPALNSLDARLDALEASPAASADKVTSAAYNREAGASRFAMWMDSSLNIGRSTSSRRYKSEIEDHPIDPDAVLALRPVSYQHKSDPPGTREFGLIAEDTFDAGVPEIVTYFGGRIDSIRYDLLSVALLSVVQRQDAQLRDLTARLAALEGPATDPTPEEG